MVGRAALILLVLIQIRGFAQAEPPRRSGQDIGGSGLKPQVVGADDYQPRVSGSGSRSTTSPRSPSPLGKTAGAPAVSPLRPELPPPDRALRADSRPADPAADDTLRSDARLADVCFIGPQCGWAVGDRGAIWHTDDGGRHWQLQESGVACALKSVWFLNERTGWAAGGFTHPFLHTGSGVLLWTRDGGRHWQHDPKLLLPPLAQVRFFSERQGWAVGCASAMFPAGIFVTQDGGASWMPPCGAATNGWLAGDFLDLRTGVVVGRSGSVAAIQNGDLRVAQPGLAAGDVTRVKLMPPDYGWLVGDAGLVMCTTDQGRTWGSQAGTLPRIADGNLAPQFDFAALAVRGPKCWIAGSPGSRVFHSSDAGRTWNVFPTCTTLPIRALTFADDLHGWAVGDLGTILATDDGGRTWQRQRAGGAKAALLAFCARPAHVPLELLARHCGGDGHLGVVQMIGHDGTEVHQRQTVPAADRVHEAVVAVGGSGAETPSASLARELEPHIVRQIRLWRPDVIVNQDVSSHPGDPLALLVSQAVQEAIPKAADPACFPEQLALAGLSVWQVKRVYAVMPPGTRSGDALATGQLVPRLGRTLEDVVARPRALLDEQYRPTPATVNLRLLSSQVGAGRAVAASYSEGAETASPAAARGDLFAGLALPANSEARRAMSTKTAENLDLLQRLAARRRHSQAILDRFEQDPQAAVQLLAQTEELTRGMAPASAALVMHRLGDRYHRSGRWDLAADCFQSLVERYGDDPVCRAAVLWLVQYYASGEAGACLSPDQRNSHLSRAVALGQEIERTRPDLFAESEVRFPMAAACRRLGQAKQAERLCLVERNRAEHDAWRACAQGEAWLVQPKGPSPKPLLTCVKATTRPKLDGRLDDAVWQQAKPAALVSPLKDDAEWPATVMLAHDDRFLYVAMCCRQAPGAQYPAATGARTRDSDLTERDRVEIFLDIDRDYATYYRLAIDHRGWAADACFGDPTWDPKWFIAAHTEDGVWTAEAAIPLDELAGRERGRGPESAGLADSNRTVWAVGVQRVVPGVGFQSWTAAAAPSVVPKGFGYAVFE
jgi:photosystem II stability/assembly factor-like uncharacterized protein